MAKVIVYALSAALAAADAIGLVAPRNHDIRVRDGQRYKSLVTYPHEVEEGATAYAVLVTDTTSLSAAEQAVLDAVQVDHVSAAAFQVSLKDDATVDYVATAAKLVDTALRIANENHAPTLANALVNKTVVKGVALVPYAFAANTFADADGTDVLTYSATLSSGAALPGWLTFTPSTRRFTGTPDAGGGDNGVATIRVKATDKSGAYITGDFTITVTAS